MRTSMASGKYRKCNKKRRRKNDHVNYRVCLMKEYNFKDRQIIEGLSHVHIKICFIDNYWLF